MNQNLTILGKVFQHLFLVLSFVLLPSCSKKPVTEDSPPAPSAPVNNPPPPAVVEPQPAEEIVNPGDRQAYDKMRQEQLDVALKVRTQMLSQSFTDSERNQKLGPLAQYVLNYDYQRWTPFRSFEKDEEFFLELQNLALQDVFEKWEKAKVNLPSEILTEFDLFSGHQKSEWLIAFALSLDETSAVQKQNAKDFNFQSLSVVDILEASLERSLSQTLPQNDNDALIWKNRNAALEILEFRFNGYAQLGYEMILRSSGSRILYFRSMNVREIEFSSRMFQIALSAKQSIDKVKRSSCRIDPDVRKRFVRLKTTRAERELQSMAEGEKRKFALELFRNIENLKSNL